MSIIICEHNHYQRTASGKSWQVKPYESEMYVMKELIFFQNFQQHDSFMKALGATERIYKRSTCLGYVTTRDVCIRPDKQVKSERLFYIFEDEKDLQEHGTSEMQRCWENEKDE